MIRILLLRLLGIILIGYIFYLLYSHIFTKKRKTSQKTVKDLESTDYDKEEWERIKEELRKK